MHDVLSTLTARYSLCHWQLKDSSCHLSEIDYIVIVKWQFQDTSGAYSCCLYPHIQDKILLIN